MNMHPELLALMKHRQPISLRDQMWQEAVNFHESAQRNFEQRTDPDGRYAFPYTAGVVGLAFASELYLKTLLLIAHGKAPKGHRLNVLFAKLPAIMSSMVICRYEQRRQGSGSLFDRDLLSFSNAFVDFRYVYESGFKQLDVIGLGQFATALYETSIRLNPDLKVYEYTHQQVTSALQGFPIFPNADRYQVSAPDWPEDDPRARVI